MEGRSPPPAPVDDKPEHCFFDPTHGAGVEAAELKTPAGTRKVMVCRAGRREAAERRGPGAAGDTDGPDSGFRLRRPPVRPAARASTGWTCSPSSSGEWARVSATTGPARPGARAGVSGIPFPGLRPVEWLLFEPGRASMSAFGFRAPGPGAGPGGPAKRRS